MRKNSRQRLGLLGLLWALMLLTCTPLPSGYPARFVRDRQQIYLGLLAWADNRDLQPGMSLPLANLAVWDANRGQWVYLQPNRGEAPPEAVRGLAQRLPAAYPRVACAPEDTSLCLRVPRLCSEAVEISRDGGTTWEIGWQLPPRRRDFFWRMQRWPLLLSKRKPRGLCALDVVWVSDARAFVALGSEGLLAFRPPEAWERRSLASARPTPLRLPGAEALLFVLPEMLLVGLVASWLTFFLAARWIGDGQGNATTPPHLQEAVGPLKWGLGLGTTALLLLLAAYGAPPALPYILFPLALLLAGIGGLLYLWGWFILLSAVGQMGAAGRWLVGQHLLLLSLPLALWLWGMGWWPLTYLETVAVTLVGLAFTGWQAFRRRQTAHVPANAKGD